MENTKCTAYKCDESATTSIIIGEGTPRPLCQKCFDDVVAFLTRDRNYDVVPETSDKPEWIQSTPYNDDPPFVAPKNPKPVFETNADGSKRLVKSNLKTDGCMGKITHYMIGPKWKDYGPI